MTTIETETTLANGHTPRRARSTRPAESLAYVPGQLKSLRKAALARKAELEKELDAIKEELGIDDAPRVTLDTPIVNFGALPSIGAGAPPTAPKPSAKARTRKPATTAADATPRAPRGSRIEAADNAISDIVGALRSSETALSSEQIQKHTGIDKAVIGLALNRGVKAGTFIVEGQKRSARYSLMTDAP